MKAPIFVDFHNLDLLGRVRLNTAGTIADLNRTGLRLTQGIELLLVSDEWKGEGTAEYSQEEQLWTARFSWDKLQSL
jgi:hypothetical protein